MLKTIPNFKDYAVTKNGQIWSKYSHQWLILIEKRPRTGDNYLSVALYKGKKGFWKSVHRLVLETFKGSCPKGMECRHLDGNKQNNELKNLCWGTRKQNIQDSILQGTHQSLHQNGSKNPRAKLTEQDAKMIIYIFNTGLFAQTTIADFYNVVISVISNIVNKKRWKHIWKLKEKICT